MSKSKKRISTIYDYGINDAGYRTCNTIEGVRVYCQYYLIWVDMLKRCYSEDFHKKYPSYKDCVVCDDWLLFSNFKSWMQNQDWEGKELDKDILIPGNKVYGPTGCCFVPQSVNGFIIEPSVSNGPLPTGVTKRPTGSYRARINVDGKRKHLGDYKTPEEAHQAWIAAKVKRAIDLSVQENLDENISTALINRYLHYTSWK